MIQVENLHKTFKLYRSPALRLKELVFRRSFHREFEALRGVSFRVQTGETLGIIGQNGAGKSTILKILTGVLLPDAGLIQIGGKITGLLELGTGFNAEFTGLQNIHMNGTLLGMSKSEIQKKTEAILEFSELAEFIREPIKTYSSGMIMRLAFSIAIHADPQAFVVDEALSVGDAYFQQKCMKKIQQFKETGGSIVFVSHDSNAVKVLCDRAILLDHGMVADEGEPDSVLNTYNFFLARKAKGEEIRFDPRSDRCRSYGNFKAKITAVNLEDAGGEPAECLVSGAACRIVITLAAEQKVDDVSVGILIRDRFGQDIYGTNTYHQKLPLALKRGEMCRVIYALDELNLGVGKYTLTVAAHRQATHVDDCYQWMDGVRTFEVVAPTGNPFIGLARLKPSVMVEHLRRHDRENRQAAADGARGARKA